jgi:pyroglutamyl-peptidase
MRVLVTGFEPYWDYTINSSWAVACEVKKLCISDVEVIVKQMPVRFAAVADALKEAVKECQPGFILMLGQSGGSDRIKLERVALNMMDARLADNDGIIPDNQPIDKEGEAAFFTNVPIKEILSALNDEGIMSKISNSCGLYVCNRLYYEALKITKEFPNIVSLFVHLPFYEGQPTAKTGKPTMPITEMIKAISTIINVIHG